MKLAEQLLESPVCTAKTDESMGSNDRINIRLEDGHSVSVHCSFDIFKGYNDGAGEKVDDVEKQSKIKEMISTDMDLFMKSVAARLKALKQL